MCVSVCLCLSVSLRAYVCVCTFCLYVCVCACKRTRGLEFSLGLDTLVNEQRRIATIINDHVGGAVLIVPAILRFFVFFECFVFLCVFFCVFFVGFHVFVCFVCFSCENVCFRCACVYQVSAMYVHHQYSSRVSPFLLHHITISTKDEKHRQRHRRARIHTQTHTHTHTQHTKRRRWRFWQRRWRRRRGPEWRRCCMSTSELGRRGGAGSVVETHE